VSLNEYVEIAKLYSTHRSGGFINGTLDGIVNQLKKENKLTKE
jgi:N utilization substance protein B